MFEFEQDDLEWINPLVLEWVEENEGKTSGDLITELLKDYKHRKGEGTLKSERSLKFEENVKKIKDTFEKALNPLKSKLGGAMDSLTRKTNSLDLDAKVGAVNEKMKRSFTKATDKFKGIIDKSTEKLKKTKQNESTE
jgi:hypothetical protein